MEQHPKKLLSDDFIGDQVRETIRRKHYSIRTEKSYVAWIKRYIFFHNKRHHAVLPIWSYILKDLLGTYHPQVLLSSNISNLYLNLIAYFTIAIHNFHTYVIRRSSPRPSFDCPFTAFRASAQDR